MPFRTPTPTEDFPLVSPRGLRRWRAALGDANDSVVNIVCAGDSITRGAYSENAGAIDDAVWRSKSWPARLRAMFTTILGYSDPGEGYVLLDDNSGIVVFGGGAVLHTGTYFSPYSVGYFFPAGAGSDPYTVTLNLPACTGFDIVGSWEVATSTMWSYTVDGGAPVTPATPAQDGMFKESVSGLTYTTHTVVITPGPVSGTKYRGLISGVIVRNASSGVRVHRAARFGTNSSGTCGASRTATQQGWIKDALLKAPSAHLVVYMIGSNDALAAVGLATYKANVKAITDWAATLNACTLLVADPRRVTVANQDAYAARLKEVALENDHVSFFDMKTFLGDYATYNAAPFSGYQDGVHPNRKGNGDMARIVFQAITDPSMVM